MNSSFDQKYDVLVIGGGHVGLYAAARFAELGFHTAVIEKKKVVGERVVCTGIISEEAFEQYQMPSETIIGGIQDVRFYSPSLKHFDYNPPKPLAKIVNRSHFNRWFEDRALRANVKIITDTDVQKVRVKKEFVSVKLNDDRHLEADLLVLATGVNTHLFHSVGIRPPSGYLGGAQVDIPYRGEQCTRIYTGNQISPGAFGWLVPLTDGVAKVGVLSEKNPGYHLKQLLSIVLPGWRDDISESKFNLRPIVQGPLDKSFADRVLVVGEAAGQIKTTTGGGIYYGMLGADAAVEVAEKAFKKNRFKADVLSSYDKQWKKKMAEELRVGHYFRKIYAKFSDDQIESIFDKLIQRDILNLAYAKAEFDWHRGLMGSVAKLPAIRNLIQNPF